MDHTWKTALVSEFKQTYFTELAKFVEEERKTCTVYPPPGDVFKAYDLTPFDKVKVVVLGQDPYHGPNQAHGLAFSVKPGVILPPSLVNILKECSTDVGFKPAGQGCLEHWSRQGVLLLNTVLTVRCHEPGSHRDRGWEKFTDATILALNNQEKPIIFVLWGSDARRKAHFIDSMKHLVLEAPHPSPLSAFKGFFGSKPFSSINNSLKTMGLDPIDWQLPNR